jgi:ribosomal protein RSM22 (predicted rRNA methylase)
MALDQSNRTFIRRSSSNNTFGNISSHSWRQIATRWSHSEIKTASKSEEFSDLDFDDLIDDDGEEDSNDGGLSSKPWKNLLESAGRAAWRVTDPILPSRLSESYERILHQGGRTPKQLKRAHGKVLSIHNDLAEFRERERRRLVNGKQYRPKNSRDDSSNSPVYYAHDETLATLKHRLMPNFAISKRILEECQSLLGRDNWEPKRVLDFGIGCGSSSLAVLNLFENVEWIHGIDPSQAMRDCSQSMIEGMAKDREVPPRVTYSTSLSTDSASSAGNVASFDLALCSYTATDLPDITSTLAATAIMFEKLKPGGVFVMIEPGTPDGFNSIRSVRNMLLDCCPPEDPDFEWNERCHIIAPCTHNGSCPMDRHKKHFVKRGKLGHDLPQNLEVTNLDENMSSSNELEFEEALHGSSENSLTSETDAFNSAFCSFVQTLPNSVSGEKFSYLVAQKRIYGATNESSDPFKDDKLTELLSQAHDAATREDDGAALRIFEQARHLESRYLDSEEDGLGLELLRGDEKRGRMGRIIRAPIKKKGHVYIDYCSSPGRIIRSRVTKATGNKTAPGIYSAARKSRWGGLWPDTTK